MESSFEYFEIWKEKNKLLIDISPLAIDTLEIVLFHLNIMRNISKYKVVVYKSHWFWATAKKLIDLSTSWIAYTISFPLSKVNGWYNFIARMAY